MRYSQRDSSGDLRINKNARGFWESQSHTADGIRTQCHFARARQTGHRTDGPIPIPITAPCVADALWLTKLQSP